MIIKDLLKGLHVETNVDENLDIKGIAYDSRRVKDGDIFVCIKGFASDGHQYIRSAAENGAACALVQAGENYEEGILPLVICESTRVALGKVSATFFGHPEKKLELFAGQADSQSAVLSLRIKGLDCDEAAQFLSGRGICLRSGLHCAPLAHRSAGTLDTGTLRMSFSPFVTRQDVRICCAAVRELCAGVR